MCFRFFYLLISVILLTSCSENAPLTIQKEGYLTGADSAQIHFKIAGVGADTLVIIHGGPGAGIYSFFEDLHPLANDFTLVFYDQRGGGKSTLPEDTSKLKPEFFVEDLEALRKHFNLNTMNVIAHSFGGILLAEYARKYPNHLKRVVFHKATGPIRSEMAAYYQAKSQEPSIEVDTNLTQRSLELLSSLLHGTAENPVQTCQEYEYLSKEIALAQGKEVNFRGTTCKAPPEAVKYYYQYTAQLAPQYFGPWNYSSTLDSLTAPVLVIYGAEDSLGIPSQQSWIKAIQNSRLLLVPGASEAVLADRPRLVGAAIIQFFRGEWPSGVL